MIYILQNRKKKKPWYKTNRSRPWIIRQSLKVTRLYLWFGFKCFVCDHIKFPLNRTWCFFFLCSTCLINNTPIKKPLIKLIMNGRQWYEKCWAVNAPQTANSFVGWFLMHNAISNWKAFELKKRSPSFLRKFRKQLAVIASNEIQDNQWRRQASASWLEWRRNAQRLDTFRDVFSVSWNT